MSTELMILLGGTALLVFSIDELAKSVQYLAGSRFRAWINNFAGNRFSSVLLGTVLSLLLSSSGAVTVMLVGLANSRLLTLEQVFSVMLGASIGTTLIVHLVAFNISKYGLIFIAGGVALDAVSESEKVSRFSKALLYLGLVFYSMSLVVTAGKALESNELFQFSINYFQDRPVFSLLVSAFLTAFIHSSAATIAFVMSLMMTKNSTVYEAIPWVLGANLGTTMTAYVASLKSGVLGKQAAVGNLISKLVGVAICLPLAHHLGELAEKIGGDVSRQIATAHTLFNVFLAILFLPFVSWGVALARKIVPPKAGEGEFSFQYLDPKTLDAPELALAQAQREILRLSDIAEKMVAKCLTAFETGSLKEIEEVKAMDQVADFLNRGIKMYLTKLSQKDMTSEQAQKEFELVLRTHDLENIGDIVDKNILELVRKNIKKGYAFSKEGWAEILQFHQKVVECVRLSTVYFSSRDRAVLSKLEILHEQIQDMTIDLSELHLQRLHRGVKESLDTTSVHLDLLANLERIADVSVNFIRISIPQTPQNLE